MASNEQNFTNWNIIYNNTDIFLDYTIRQLFPGTEYLIKLAVSFKDLQWERKVVKFTLFIVNISYA